jgi:adenylate cyclase
MPRKLFYYRLRTLAAISVAWIIFGAVFFSNLIKPSNDLGVQVNLFQFCFTFGITGLIITAALIFYLKPAFNHLPIWTSILIKLLITIFLFFLIGCMLLMVYFFLHYSHDLSDYLKSFFTKLVYTNTFVGYLIDMALVTLLTILILEITDKYGPGMFWSLLRGKYHNPKIESRIVIFLDINESTSIAEELGHEQYFRMLRQFFKDITIPVLANDGEIYQYVGDEIVLTWINTPENKIKSLKFIRNTFFLLERLNAKYQRRFGRVPRFKAGIHAGEVTAGFIGVIKKDLIFCGDTMNTAARIRSMCNELNESFILSQDFMADFATPHGYSITQIGTLELKGKLEPMQLFSLKLES